MLAALVALTALSACHNLTGPDLNDVIQKATRQDLQRFDSDEALHTYVSTLAAAQRRHAEESWGGDEGYSDEAEDAPAPPSEAPSAEAPAGESTAGESVTNTQEVGVDEGGIIKTHGDHLVVLRRGRLFSVKLGADALEPTSMVNAFPPDGGADGWYDELLIHDDTIVVIGYNYGQGGTEIGLFDINDAGTITWRATHFLRSNDYYSSRNYASRLLGDKLVFYMPYALASYRYDGGAPTAEVSLPGVRTWRPGMGATGWSDVITATDIYQPIQPTETPILHTVVTCDLGAKDLACKARGIVGPYGRNFYVSAHAVYVWVQGGYADEAPRQEVAQTPAAVYRLALDSDDVGALRTWGAPTDQFSFKEDADGNLNVLVRAEGGGDWMWNPEGSQGDVALLRVPTAAFGEGVATVKAGAYTDLPRPSGGWVFQNRFVGDYILYGTGSGWGYVESERDERIFAYNLKTGSPTAKLALPHGVDRIEALGRNAVVVGTDGQNLHFTALDLSHDPTIAGAFIQPSASQGETRSHGFFFKPSGERDGVLGLPIREANRPGFTQLAEGSASVLYLDVHDLKFGDLGKLDARADRFNDDQCVASCADWYGNARPIFLKGRTFALLGYELVEGRVTDGVLAETRRVNFLTCFLGAP